MTNRRRRCEGGGIAALAVLAAYFIAASWRKWPDPLVDFGRELYLPWRISHGAVLYRDVDDFYGPLSQYLNAAIFKVFGAGMMVLVAANLAVFAVICAVLYSLFRKAWGAGVAWVSTAVFIAVFGFSQFVSGSFTYAAPYAHEATHGFLVCAVLVLVLHRWVERPSGVLAMLAGLLVGLAAILKPEILLAASVVTAAAVVFALRARRAGRPIKPVEIIVWAAGALLPTAGFACFFARSMPGATALASACRAWLSVVATTRYTHESLQLGFMGLDHPWPNAVAHVEAGLLAAAIVAAVGASSWLVGALRSAPLRWSAGAALVALAGCASALWIQWIQVGRCLPVAVLLYLVAAACRGTRDPVQRLRFLVALLAAALLARMVLNGRIYQFGFYQAALAGALLPAILLGDVRERVGSGAWARRLAVAAGLALVAPAVVRLAVMSHRRFALMTQPVGQGIDRFYALDARLDPTGRIVDTVSGWMRQVPATNSVLVVPEGEMINYLSRRASPVAPFFFFSAALSGGREAALVQELDTHPPDWVVIISRDLREYGIARYGEAPGRGQLILNWVDQHYQLEGATGGDPLDPRERGAVVLGRR